MRRFSIGFFLCLVAVAAATSAPPPPPVVTKFLNTFDELRAAQAENAKGGNKRAEPEIGFERWRRRG